MGEPQVWDGKYEKVFYYVHLGEERVVCWPNAGIMNATDGSGRRWRPEDAPLVSVVPDEEAPHKQHRMRRAKAALSIAVAVMEDPIDPPMTPEELKELRASAKGPRFGLAPGESGGWPPTVGVDFGVRDSTYAQVYEGRGLASPVLVFSSPGLPAKALSAARARAQRRKLKR